MTRPVGDVSIGVVHRDLNSLGGAERVCVTLIEALNHAGYRVVLATMRKPDFGRIERVFGKRVKVGRLVTLTSFNLPMLGLYKRLLIALAAGALKSRVIVNTHGDVMLVYTRQKTVTYFQVKEVPMEYLITRTLFPTGSPHKRPRNYPPSKYMGGMWRIYFTPYAAISRKVVKSNIDKGVFLTNSAFSAEAIGRVIGRHLTVIPPPVDLAKFGSASLGPHDRRTIVVTARYTPEKGLEDALTVLEMLPGWEMELNGSLTTANRGYFERLRRIAREKGVGDRVKLSANASLDYLIDAYSHAKVYLHTRRGEHFGISIVEAMSAGLIPVVPDHGGQTEYVPARYQYHTLEEAARKIDRYGDAGQAERQSIIDMSRRFSEDHFKTAMLKVVEGALD